MLGIQVNDAPAINGMNAVFLSVPQLRSRIEHKHPNFRMCLPRWSSKDRSSGSCWLPRMEQLFDGLFRVLDPRAVLAIVLLCFELLQETETRRSGRVPRSAVLGHAETLLAAMRHLITNGSCAAHFLRPGVATGAKLHAVRRKHNQRER